MTFTRRKFIACLSGTIAAPMVVKATSLDLVRGLLVPPDIVIDPSWPLGWMPSAGQPINRWQFPELHARLVKLRLYNAHKSAVIQLPNTAGMIYYTNYHNVPLETAFECPPEKPAWINYQTFTRSVRPLYPGSFMPADPA
jgi:hypothetical protein